MSKTQPTDEYRLTETEPVAIIADSHDRTDLVIRQINDLLDREIELLIHLGDVCTPETMELFAESFEVHAVFGNGAVNRNAIEHIVNSNGGVHHGEQDRLRIADKLFHIHHGIDHGKSYGIARGHTGVDYVLHGHWHNAEHNTYDNGAVLNPGSEGVWLYETYADSFDYEEFEFDKPRDHEE